MTRYAVDSNASIYSLKTSFNSFLDELGKVEVKQLLVNPNLLTSSGSSAPSWETLGVSALTYNSTLGYSTFTLAAGGYVSQEISEVLTPNTNYTAVIYSNVPLDNILQFSVSAVNSNQIFNVNDLTQINQATVVLNQSPSGTSLVKNILNFSTNSISVSGNIHLSLTNISASAVNINLNTFCLYKGLVELSGIIATVIPNDTLLAGIGLKKVPASGSASNILNVLVSGSSTNQVIVNEPTSAGNNIVLSLPQDIGPNSNVEFGSINTVSVSAATINNVMLITPQPSASLYVNANASISGPNTGDQNITISGDCVAASGSSNINLSIPDTVVTSKVLTGYVTPSSSGSSIPVATTDSILQAIEKLQNSINIVQNRQLPVGSIYCNANNGLNPSDPSLLGYGNWSPIGAGRFLIGAGTLGTDTYVATQTGGEAKHTLTTDEMPTHHHSFNQYNQSMELRDQAGTGHFSPSTGTNSNAGQTGDSGANTPHENRPPYVVVFMWVRTPD